MYTSARRVCVIVTSALTLMTMRTLGAQSSSLPTGPAVERALHDTTLVTQIPGRWKMSAFSADTRLTPAERSAMHGSLTSIAELLHTALGTLPGVEADASLNADDLAVPGGAHVAAGSVKTLVWPYSVRNGKLAFYNNAAEALFWVNHTVCEGDEAITRGLGFIYAPRLNGTFHGFPMLDSTIVITHRTQPPCLPVSREEVLQALLNQMRAGGAAADSSWNAGAAERERGMTELAKTNPTAAASARAEMTRMKHVSDSVRASVRSALQNAIARMSPAERASPAYVSDSSCRGEDLSSCFVAAGVADGRAVVRENSAFFDTARPAEVQLVTLSLKSLYAGSANAEYPTKVMGAALERFDWSALNALVH